MLSFFDVILWYLDEKLRKFDVEIQVYTGCQNLVSEPLLDVKIITGYTERTRN